MAHLEPLSKSFHPELEPMFDHYQSTRGFIPNSILTMQRRPEIAKMFMKMNQVILYEGTVKEELKMLISLIASQASGCRYCQAHMANLSKIYNASKEKIEAVWEFKTSSLFTNSERAALNLAFKGASVPNRTTKEDFNEIKKYFDEGQIVEIVASIGLFGYLNRWNDTMATDLEEFPKKAATELIGANGWNPGKHS